MFKLITFTAFLAVAAALHPRLDGRIVGGDDANIVEFPYQLSLQTYGRHICGASIINEKWAVTAAHCTAAAPASALTVVAGISHQSESGQRLGLRNVYQHPRYNPYTTDFDISILELDGAIEFGSNAQPVNLPAFDSDPVEGTSVTVTGWGTLYEGGSVSKQLQKVDIEIVSRDNCNKQYGGQITDRMICAGIAKGGKDACQGDSGGPLVGNGQLLGVVSWGYGCARPAYSGVYSNVGNLRNYIKKVSGL